VVTSSGVTLAILIAEAAGAAAGDGKLPPPAKAAALMALLGIALLGMLLVVIILLGGHWVRRQGAYRPGPAVPPDRASLSSSNAAPSGVDPADAEGDKQAISAPDDAPDHGDAKAS
jgi:hypothetical protein